MNEDLHNLLSELEAVNKSYSRATNKIKEQESTISLLKEEIKIARDNEQILRNQLNRKQQNLKNLLGTVQELAHIKEDNQKLIKEQKALQELLGQEKQKFQDEKDSWSQEKEEIGKNKQDELDNVKKFRNMEVQSLNREIARLQEEDKTILENMQNEVKRTEENYKRQLSQTISIYEEKLIKMNGDLAAAQTEMKNLRQRCTSGMNIYNNVEMCYPRAEMVQPSSRCSRYQPLPIVTTATQMYTASSQQIGSETNMPAESNIPKDISKGSEVKLAGVPKKINFPVGRKRKLYTPVNDIL